MSSTVALPSLRELTRANDSAVFQFCYLILGDIQEAEELLLKIFEDFGNNFRKMEKRRGRKWGGHEAKLVLFALAWDYVKKGSISRVNLVRQGRDLRPVLERQRDIHQHPLEHLELVWKRISTLDPEHCAPLILKDLLGFPDEDVSKVLRLRWGVYRHRLHRGRTEFIELLKGHALDISSGQKKMTNLPESQVGY